MNADSISKPEYKMGRLLENQFRERLVAVRSELSKWRVDGLLIGSASNRRWLSGFTGSSGWLLVTTNSAILGTDFRYWDQARLEAPSFEIRNFREGSAEAWPALLDFKQDVRLGIEANHITLAQYKEFSNTQNVTFVELGSVLEGLREVKNAQEIDTIRKAAAITDAVMAEVNALARVGVKEAELAWELERRMRDRGASGMAFPVIVAFGANSAMAHHQPGERALKGGDPVIVDMGAEVQGYASDLTRSFFAGSELTAEYRERFGLVLAAQRSALEGIRAGVTGREADTFARDTIAEGGYGPRFGHSLGHGVGLDIHEGPSLSQVFGTAPMRAGSVVTVEPGIYIGDWGGIRIEDLVLVTENGIEQLSQCVKTPTLSGN